jgi:PKHD-type hydroxylase
MNRPLQKLREEIFHPFVGMHCGFTDAQLDQIVEIGRSSQTHEGVTADGRGSSNTRTCTLSWLMPTPETQWIFDGIANCFLQLNDEYYKFILDLHEPLQFTNYNEDRAEFYAPHIDSMFGEKSQLTTRKLSLTLQLTDPSTYEGGDLLMYVGYDNPVPVPRDRGTIIVFPSFIMHEVTPVRRGRRNSLVTWAHGPLFQ